MTLRHDEAVACRWPTAIRRWRHAHRIEGSVRPSAPSSHGAIDRHPSGLIHRIVECANPFLHHQVVHLGLVGPSSPLAPVLVWARVEGVAAILGDIKKVSRTEAEHQAFRDVLLDELDRLAEATEHDVILHPDLLLRLSADRLQKELDHIFGIDY